MDLHPCVCAHELCSESCCLVKGELRNLRLALNHKPTSFEGILQGVNYLALIHICPGTGGSMSAFLCQPCLAVWAEA